MHRSVCYGRYDTNLTLPLTHWCVIVHIHQEIKLGIQQIIK